MGGAAPTMSVGGSGSVVRVGETVAAAGRAEPPAPPVSRWLAPPDVGRLVRLATAAVGRPDLDALPEELLSAPTLAAAPTHARLHRVEGCVHETLRARAAVDPSILATLANARTGAARQHLRTVRTVRALASVLGDAGIGWLVMKGPVLAGRLYGDVGLRSSIDLDLLVARRDFARAVRALEAAGYVHLFRNWPFVWDARAGELPLGAGDVTLDAHWHLLFGAYDRRHFDLDPAAFMERARVVDVGGVAIPTFDEVDTLLHLALHGAHSGADRLVWLKDIERSLSVERPDLDELVARARRFRCHLPVGVALRRAQRTVAAPVPDGLVEALSGRAVRDVDRALTSAFPVERTLDRGNPATFVARCLVGSRRGSVARLAGAGYHYATHRRRQDLDEHDPRRPDSPTFARGTDVDKDRFLDWVSAP